MMTRIFCMTLMATLVSLPLHAQPPLPFPDPFQPGAMHERLTRDWLPPAWLNTHNPSPHNHDVGRSNIFAGGVFDNTSAADVWGCVSIPLPEYLRAEALGLLPRQGLLITKIHPGSAAQQAGLCVGDLLMLVDGQPCLADRPLPSLNQPRCVFVLSDAGLREVTVEPVTTGYGGPSVDTSVLRHPLPHLGTSHLDLNKPAVCAASAHAGNAAQSIAISQVDGQTVVSAVVLTAEGPVQVKLIGTPYEVECQLQKLAPDIQLALRAQLGL